MDGDEPMADQRLGLSFRLDRRDGLEHERALRELTSSLADQDLPRLRRLLQACGNVDGVTRRKRPAAARDDLARVDADAHGELDAELVTQLVIQRAQPLAKLNARTSGSEGVVLVDGRHAKDRHHRVADVLLDAAAVPLEHLSGNGEVALHHLAQRLGVEPLAKRRRARDVGEDDRHDLAQLACRLGGGQGGAARVAEASLRPVLLTTGAADRHLRSVGRSSRGF